MNVRLIYTQQSTIKTFNVFESQEPRGNLFWNDCNYLEIYKYKKEGSILNWNVVVE